MDQGQRIKKLESSSSSEGEEDEAQEEKTKHSDCEVSYRAKVLVLAKAAGEREPLAPTPFALSVRRLHRRDGDRLPSTNAYEMRAGVPRERDYETVQSQLSDNRGLRQKKNLFSGALRSGRRRAFCIHLSCVVFALEFWLDEEIAASHELGMRLSDRPVRLRRISCTQVVQ